MGRVLVSWELETWQQRSWVRFLRWCSSTEGFLQTDMVSVSLVLESVWSVRRSSGRILRWYNSREELLRWDIRLEWSGVSLELRS